jgi:hypothetical protein
VQHGGGGIHRDRPTGLDPGVVPAFAVRVPNGDHVIGEDPPESGVGQQRGPLGGGYRRRIPMNLELEVLTAVHMCCPP